MASSVNRIVGEYAVCQIGHTNAILNFTEWQVQIRTEFVDATGFGDFWDVPVVIKYLWTARLRGFITPPATYLQAYSIAQKGVVDIVAATFAGFLDVGAKLPVFQGSGFTERTALMVPMAMAEQEIEIRGVGSPAFID